MNIILYGKKECGVLSYESIKKYNSYVNDFESSMERIFGSDVKKIKTECNFEARGFFRIEYIYYPQNYKLIIEYSFPVYDVTICDGEGAKNYLFNIIEYKPCLETKNIETAILYLHEVLERNDFDLFVCKGKNLYKKSENGLVKIKKLWE